MKAYIPECDLSLTARAIQSFLSLNTTPSVKVVRDWNLESRSTGLNYTMVESFRKYMRAHRLEEIEEEARRKHEEASELLHMHRETKRRARALDEEIAMMKERANEME